MPPAIATEPLSSPDGVTSEVRIYEGSDLAPVVLFMPAMGVPARYYQPLGEAASASGLNLVVGELRGVGSSSVRPTRGQSFGYHEMLAHDFPALVERVRRHFPDQPLYLGGHSLGGQLATLYGALEPTSARGLFLVATASVDFRGYPFPRNLGVLLGTQAAHAVAQLLGYFPGHRLGFGGLQARGVIADWSYQGRTGRYAPQGSSADFEAKLGALSWPVLSVDVEGDALAPGSAVDRLCAKLTAASVQRWTFAPPEPTDHFRWVKQAGPLLSRAQEWMATHGPARG